MLRDRTARPKGCNDADVSTSDAGPSSGAPPTVRGGFSAGTKESALRLSQLARVMAELAAAESMATIGDVVVSHIGAAVGAAVATLMLRDGDRVNLVAAHGVRPGVQEEFASFGVQDVNPASEAIRSGEPQVLSASDGIATRYPVLAARMPPGRSLVCLPLIAGARPLGAIGLTFEQSWTPGPRELEFLTTFADACAQAVRRARATEELEERARQLQFLAEASIELASSLDYRATLSNVANLLVPTLADWCGVAIAGEHGLVTVAVAHVDPARVAWAWELQERYPPDPDAPTGAPAVLRTGVSELYEEITDELLVATAVDEEHLALSRELGMRSAMVVPLTARGRVLGVATLIRTNVGRNYDQADLVFAEDLGRRAGQAVDNARLHGQAQNVALQLRQAVLPDDLTGFEEWTVAAYYSPDGSAEVGGDFYDAVALEDGRLVVFIGDVAGHGLAAAAAMAHVRAATRAYLAIDPEPGQVVTKLDAMFERLSVSQLVSLCYLVLDPTAGELSYVNAGHYPPLLLGPQASPRFATTPPQRPLGAGGDTRQETVIPFAEDETLLLYTDGLIERRGEVIDTGLERLARQASSLAGAADLPSALRDLVQAQRGAQDADDVTAIALRRRPH